MYISNDTRRWAFRSSMETEKSQINKKSLRYRFTAGTIGVSVWQQE